MSVPNEELPAYILMLNDDCLKNIMDMLSRNDFISFALSCSRILGVSDEQRCKKLFEHLDLKELDDIPLFNRMPFFQFFGHFIKELNIVPKYNTIFNDQELFELVGTYCINIKSIKIMCIEISILDMRMLFSKMNQLENVELIRCGLKDAGLLELNHLSQLKKLDISESYGLTGLNMNRLPASIESLSIWQCYDLPMELLPEICQALPKLKELEVYELPELKTLFQQLLRDHCCDLLESVKFGLPAEDYDQEEEDAEYAAIAMLPKLKKLTIVSSWEEMYPDSFTMLVEHKSKQLEYLKIDGNVTTDALLEISKLSALRTLILGKSQLADHQLDYICQLKQLEEFEHDGWDHNISNDGLLRLVRACPKLQKLSLGYCENITGTLLSELVRELRPQIGQKENQRPLPIKLFLKESKITKSMLRNLEVASKQIIDVTLL